MDQTIASPGMRRLSGASRVWLLNGFLAACGLGLYFGVIRHLTPPVSPYRIPWPVIATMYALAEVFVVHLQFRRNAFSFSLSEIPLVLGLFFMAPDALVLAQFAGAAVALALYRRQSPLKLTFNVLNFSLEAAIAAVVFNLMYGAFGATGRGGFICALVATSASILVGSVVVPVAVWLAEGQLPLSMVMRAFLIMFVTSITNTFLALIAVTILWRDPWTAWLLVVPVATLFLAYRAYTSERRKHERLEFLHESTRILDRSRDVESGLTALLAHVREMFRSELAEIALFPGTEHEGILRATVSADGRIEPLARVEPTALDRRWSAASGPALYRRPIADADVRGQLGARGIRDAMVAPLHGETRTVGVLLVANRMGDVSTFDEEDLRLFETLANHTSVSLENGRLEKSLAQLTELQAQRARLLDQAVQAAEDERTRLAADLHDGPIQRLSALTYSLERVRLRLRQGEIESGSEIVATLQQEMGNEIQALRRLMVELRPPILDERGLEAALFDYVLDFQERTGVECEVGAELPARLQPVHETILYRLAQEALTNAGKHARATRVAVTLGFDGPSVVLTVRDDGIGFDPDAVRAPSGGEHFGLAVMRERVEMAGGNWEIQSTPGGGTLVVASLPLDVTPPTPAGIQRVAV